MDEVNDYYNVSIKEGNLRYLKEKYGNRKLKIYRGDVANETFVDMVFAAEKPKWVCHLAARAGVRPSIQNPFIYVHSNVLGTTRLMDAAVRYKVRNFVYASSSSVYGGSSETFFDEDQPVDHPISPYAATKKITELFAYTWRHLYKLPTTGLRFFTVYGPRGRPDMAPFIFVDRVSRGLTLPQYGNGSSSRDYTYIDDIVDGVVRSIDRPYMYKIFNLGKGSGTELSDFIRIVEQQVNKTAKIEYLPDQPGDVPYTCANVTKAKTLLGYDSHTTFEAGIAKTVEWYKQAYPLDEPKKKKKGFVDDNPSIESTEDRDTNQRRRLGLPLPAAGPPKDSTHRFLRQLQEIGRLQDDFAMTWQNETVLEPHTDKKKVMVTGAAGFIGSHVADYLLTRGDEVVVIDEVNDYYDVAIKEKNLQLLRDKHGTTNRLKIYRGDIVNRTLMDEIFRTEKPKWICHLAARAGVRPSIDDPYVYIHSNIVGTTRLLSLAKDYGVENFVFASSSSVYGGSKSTFFSEEESVIHPISPYAASKKGCELLGYTFHHLYNIPVTGLRFFTVYGPRGRPDMAPFKFVDRVSRGQILPQYGDGSSSRDYTYIDDIVDGVVRAVDRPYPYQVFNLGKGSGTKLSDFIELVEKYTGLEANIKQMDDQPGDVPYTCADVRKAEYLLGYKASVPFEEGIKRTVAWYKEAYPQYANIMKKNTTDAVTKTETKESSPGVKETEELALSKNDISTESSSGTGAAVAKGPKKARIGTQEEARYMNFWERNLTTLLVLVLLFSIAARILYKRHSRKLEKLLLGNSSREIGRQQETKPFLRPATSESSSNSSNGKSARKDSDAAHEMFERLEKGSPVSTIIRGDDV
uniref:NAD(P)-binding domain-containing protein n=1 Tax=Amphora coffeiformis TaxID=265554 RepID=A0A7S3PA81_9STRA